MPRRVVIVISVVLVAIVAFAIVVRDDDPPGNAEVATSPALLAVDGVADLPGTVAELPVVDAPGFRSLMAELRGTPVVVNLWAAWCEPCEVEMPRLAEAALAHPGVQFIRHRLARFAGERRGLHRRALGSVPVAVRSSGSGPHRARQHRSARHRLLRRRREPGRQGRRRALPA